MKIENLKNKVLRPLIKIIPFSLIKRIDSPKLIIIYYHVVNDGDVPHISYLYKYKRTRQFYDDLEFNATKATGVGILLTRERKR